MGQMETSQIIQIITWFVALIELIVGLYIIAVNFRSKANLHIGVLLLVFAINAFAQGMIIVADSVSQAEIPSILLAATAANTMSGLIVIAVLLVKPAWLQGRGKYLWWFFYLMFFLPMILTITDVAFGTDFWFTGLDPTAYSGGFANLSEYAQGTLSGYIRIIGLYVSTIFLAVLLVFILIRDKTLSQTKRQLALILMISTFLGLILNFALPFIIDDYAAILITSTIFASGFAFATFRQMISEEHLPSGRLQPRLTAIILVISIPLLIAITGFSITRAGQIIQQNAVQNLENIDNSIINNTKTWLDLNIKALNTLVRVPFIVGMDPNEQKPTLEEMSKVYDHMYLISTIGLDGVNIARNDDAELKDYSDRDYVKKILAGETIAMQTVIGKTSQQPALVVAKPIYSYSNELLGIGMFASTLDTLSEVIRIENIGASTSAFIVDQDNILVAHSDPAFLTGEIIDMSLNPAVAVMRTGEDDPVVRYSDENGVLWTAIAKELDYGWGVIVQQQENELLSVFRTFQSFVSVGILIGTILLGVLTRLAIGQAIRPISTLTETATAIAGGDLSQIAPVESEDEIGTLAISFNQMTEKLIESITDLEKRVDERTADLEQRSSQLEAAADVGRVASTLLDVNELIQEVVDLIQVRFDLHYVGLFLLDETSDWAYLRAGTGEKGKAMLERRHRIRVGEGMVGWSIANAKPRIALDASEDEYRLVTAELRETRSEAAIPLRVRAQVIGAITVQDSRPGRFDDASIAVLQTMADLVAAAIENARLLTESQEALATSRRIFGEQSQRAWSETLSDQRRALKITSSERGTISTAEASWQPESEHAWEAGTIIEGEDPENYPLAVPIKIRETVIGVLTTHKPKEMGKWTPDEIAMVESIIAQLGVALEGARLYDETQRRAAFEQLTREITTRIRETMDIETVLRTATRELRQSLDLAEVEVRMGLSNNDQQHS